MLTILTLKYTCAPVGNEVSAKVFAQIQEQTKWNPPHCLPYRVRDLIRDPVWNQLGPQVYWPLRNALWEFVEAL